METFYRWWFRKKGTTESCFFPENEKCLGTSQRWVFVICVHKSPDCELLREPLYNSCNGTALTWIYGLWWERSGPVLCSEVNMIFEISFFLLFKKATARFVLTFPN